MPPIVTGPVNAAPPSRRATGPPRAPSRPIPVPAPASRFTPPGNPSLAAPQAAETAAVPAGLGALQSIDDLPPELRVGPEYGLAVLKGAAAGAKDLALFILSPAGQAILAKRGFLPVALPQM